MDYPTTNPASKHQSNLTLNTYSFRYSIEIIWIYHPIAILSFMLINHQLKRGAEMDKLNKIKSDIDKVSSDIEKISSGSAEGWEIANKIFAEYQKQNKRSK